MNSSLTSHLESTNVPDALAAARVSTNAAGLRDAAADFEALLFKEAFAPLSKAIGFYGDAVVGAATRAMLRHSSSTDALVTALSAHASEGVSP